MPLTDFLKAFLRQSAYALMLFVAVALAAEYLVPGSVTPFVDPVPLGILAFALLIADSMRRFERPYLVLRIAVATLLFALLLLLVLSSSDVHGKSDIVAAGIIIFAAILSLVAIVRRGT